MTKFKSDARPSDTKSVVLNKIDDARLLDHLRTVRSESAWWREAGYFYLDAAAWLAAQPDAPPPGQPWAVYAAWLDSRAGAAVAPVDAEALAGAILPSMRDVIEAALATALAGVALTPAAGEAETDEVELADLFDAALVLE